MNKKNNTHKHYNYKNIQQKRNINRDGQIYMHLHTTTSRNNFQPSQAK